MSVESDRPNEKDVADWTQRRDELAARLGEFEYEPQDAWLRDLGIRHTGPMAAASRDLASGVPANDQLSATLQETDRHLNDNILAVEKRAEADITKLKTLLEKSVSALDAWIEAHRR